MTCYIAVAVALNYSDHGLPWLAAAFMGAAGVVVSVVMWLVFYASVRRSFWRRTRGYPFADGDLVECTSGLDVGRRGHIVSQDQGAWYFCVQLVSDSDSPHDDDIKVSQRCAWVSAAKLKKVVPDAPIPQTHSAYSIGQFLLQLGIAATIVFLLIVAISVALP